jgi:hypothetical protein
VRLFILLCLSVCPGGITNERTAHPIECPPAPRLYLVVPKVACKAATVTQPAQRRQRRPRGREAHRPFLWLPPYSRDAFGVLAP